MHEPQLELSDPTDEEENLHHVKAFCTIEVENTIKSLGPPVFKNEDDLHLKVGATCQRRIHCHGGCRHCRDPRPCARFGQNYDTL